MGTIRWRVSTKSPFIFKTPKTNSLVARAETLKCLGLQGLICFLCLFFFCLALSLSFIWSLVNVLSEEERQEESRGTECPGPLLKEQKGEMQFSHTTARASSGTCCSRRRWCGAAESVGCIFRQLHLFLTKLSS